MELRALNRTQYGDITLKSKEAYVRLCELQNAVLQNPDQHSFEEVAEATQNWNRLASIEEHFLKQKSNIYLAKL